MIEEVKTWTKVGDPNLDCTDRMLPSRVIFFNRLGPLIRPGTLRCRACRYNHRPVLLYQLTKTYELLVNYCHIFMHHMFASQS